eukprot:PhF_6_TR29265/c0_g1_i2/m.42865
MYNTTYVTRSPSPHYTHPSTTVVQQTAPLATTTTVYQASLSQAPVGTHDPYYESTHATMTSLLNHCTALTNAFETLQRLHVETMEVIRNIGRISLAMSQDKLLHIHPRIVDVVKTSYLEAEKVTHTIHTVFLQQWCTETVGRLQSMLKVFNTEIIPLNQHRSKAATKYGEALTRLIEKENGLREKGKEFGLSETWPVFHHNTAVTRDVFHEYDSKYKVAATKVAESCNLTLGSVVQSHLYYSSRMNSAFAKVFSDSYAMTKDGDGVAMTANLEETTRQTQHSHTSPHDHGHHHHHHRRSSSGHHHHNHHHHSTSPTHAGPTIIYQPPQYEESPRSPRHSGGHHNHQNNNNYDNYSHHYSPQQNGQHYQYSHQTPSPAPTFIIQTK